MMQQQPQQRPKTQESTHRITQSAKKLVAGIFSTMSAVAHVDDDDEDDGEEDGRSFGSKCNARRGDCELSNGDFYTGEWAGGVPHGAGKYLWTDGCMYEGEWAGGEITGRGKFSWPSGATYEGEFRCGFMDGVGTYTGPAGDTYGGRWEMNRKHGEGRKEYANGDCYEGEWRWGAQDGRGKYVWKNGNEYEGEWKKGRISGKGLMVWANGNRYEGFWEDGLPKGEGKFKWADGSFYVGNWSKDEQSATYYPSSAKSGVGYNDWNPREVFSMDLDGFSVCPAAGEKLSVLPWQKMLNYGREMQGKKEKKGGGGRKEWGLGERGFDKICVWQTNGDITCDIVVGSSVVEREGKEGFIDLHVGGEDSSGERAPPRWKKMKEVKKQGETISKGHKHYELMLGLQLGIRYSVGKPAPATSLDLKLSAFDPKEKAWTKFPPEGTKHTPSHHSCEFRWKDYCPLVFRTLRNIFKIDEADYMISICGNNVLRELSSPGKSGSFFYLTHDDRYMIKTMKKSEVKVLLRMLPTYYNHVRAFENTLVTKFYGLHCVKLTGAAQRKVRTNRVMMRFDLKGSSHGRTTVKPEAEIDETTTLKDLDLNCIFRLQKSWFPEFQRDTSAYTPIPEGEREEGTGILRDGSAMQLDRDCDFLEQERIMDYSLLVGLHFREASCALDEAMTEGTGLPEEASGAGPRCPRIDTSEFPYDPSRYIPVPCAAVKLGANMPGRVEQTERSKCDAQIISRATGKIYDVVLFFGIIDILQDYDISKKLEHAYKSIQYDPTSISAVDPKQYSRRFRDFIYKVFVEDT
ncbi:hypothetical protein ACLOJK_000506 [Asimina triloba]